MKVSHALMGIVATSPPVLEWNVGSTRSVVRVVGPASLAGFVILACAKMTALVCTADFHQTLRLIAVAVILAGGAIPEPVATTVGGFSAVRRPMSAPIAAFVTKDGGAMKACVRTIARKPNVVILPTEVTADPVQRASVVLPGFARLT